MNPNQTPNNDFQPTTEAPTTPLTKKQAKTQKKANKKPLTPGQKKFRNYAITGIAGICIGAMFTSGGSTPEPEVVTETETVTKTETIEVPADFPAVCGDAYKLAEKTISFYSEVGPLASDSIDAVYRNDMAGLEALTSRIGALSDDVEGALMDYYVAKFDCADQLGTTLPSGL